MRNNKDGIMKAATVWQKGSLLVRRPALEAPKSLVRHELSTLRQRCGNGGA